MPPPDPTSPRDDDLIAHAARQVASARKPAAYFAGSSGAPGAAEPLPLSTQAEAIPGYTVVGERERGGQGVVYEAIQNATRRRVAIKVLHEAHGASLGRARFEREVEILAQLRHPHIVTIHDSARSDRRLYFVMDFVDGVPFDEFASETPDRDPGKILPVFAKVCEAVHAAHLHGVMHRDLKPGNVLVDAAAEPRVLDFGLAKRLDAGDLTEAAEMTATGQFLGSLLWAAPEQIAGDHDRVDLRCDVYALGVVLCHALTGRLPYPKSATLADAARHIRESEPLRPSLLRPGLDDELDTIILKCLRKEPAQRYQTAGELGRDVTRYLAGEPIEAKRDSLIYVMRKRLRRHRSALAVGAAFLAVAVLGLSLSLSYWRQAEVQRARADARFDDVRALAQAALFDVHDRIVDVPGTLAARKFLVESAVIYLDRLAAEHAGDAALRRELAGGYVRVGTMQGNNSRANLGDTEGALRSYARAEALLAGLLDENPGDTDVRRELASLLLYMGNVHTVRGDVAAARASYERYLIEAQAVYDATGEPSDLRDVANAHAAIAEMLSAGGRSEEALARFATASGLLETLPTTGPLETKLLRDRCRMARCIGDAHFELGDFAAARTAYESSLEFAEERLSRSPESADAQSLAAIASARLGEVLTRLTTDESPLEHLRRSVALAHASAQADLADAQAQADYAGALRGIVDFHLYRWQTAADAAAARRHLVEAIEWSERTRDRWAEIERAGKLLPVDASTPADYVAFVEMLRGKLAELDAAAAQTP